MKAAAIAACGQKSRLSLSLSSRTYTTMFDVNRARKDIEERRHSRVHVVTCHHVIRSLAQFAIFTRRTRNRGGPEVLEPFGVVFIVACGRGSFVCSFVERPISQAGINEMLSRAIISLSSRTNAGATSSTGDARCRHKLAQFERSQLSINSSPDLSENQRRETFHDKRGSSTPDDNLHTARTPGFSIDSPIIKCPPAHRQRTQHRRGTW
ncbi:hypothetical protein Trydic_g7174 [Trypoxylus dichotomus]